VSSSQPLKEANSTITHINIITQCDKTRGWGQEVKSVSGRRNSLGQTLVQNAVCLEEVKQKKTYVAADRR
jgi:hypothetical protein